MTPRESDLYMLRKLANEELPEADEQAFASMLAYLETPNQTSWTLSADQRGWVTRRADEHGISAVDPAERNKDVPRGKEVAPALVLLRLPKSPPKRRPAS